MLNVLYRSGSSGEKARLVEKGVMIRYPEDPNFLLKQCSHTPPLWLSTFNLKKLVIYDYNHLHHGLPHFGYDLGVLSLAVLGTPFFLSPVQIF